MSDVKFIEQGHEIWGIFKNDGYTEPHDFIAKVARVCYKSKSTGAESDERLSRRLVEENHDAMVEHSFMSVKFVTNIGVSREIIRHRLFSFAEQSTRYVNFNNKGFEFVLPNGLSEMQEKVMQTACKMCSWAYDLLIRLGLKPEMARSVLPLCTATNIVVSGNMREWRHFFDLRCDKRAHPQIRELANDLLDDVKQRVPVLFEDIQP